MQTQSKKHTVAFAYFITIRTYATWLHGDERSSVDRKHNTVSTPRIQPSRALHAAMQSNIGETEFLLNEKMRNTVLQSMIQTCRCLKWKIFAIHVRTNHIHIVLQSQLSKEETMGKLKRYATVDLKKNHPELSSRHKFWSRHASTKNIWAPETLFPALYYVVKCQGSPMALYYDAKYYDPLDEALYECYLNR